MQGDAPEHLHNGVWLGRELQYVELISVDDVTAAVVPPAGPPAEARSKLSDQVPSARATGFYARDRRRRVPIGWLRDMLREHGAYLDEPGAD